MLLIAQPKSASTSLAKTIAAIGRLKNCKLGIPGKKIDLPCKGFSQIQKYHNNMVERSPLFLQQVISGRNIFFKEHLLPTKRHIEILNKIKGRVAILLRNPEDSLDSYRRGNVKGDMGKLERDLKQFHQKWMWYASNKPHVITIDYEDLILNYNKTMRRLLDFYRIKGKIIPLKKLRFTGVGVKRVTNSTA